MTIPASPRLIADDATPEAVASLLAEHGERMALMSSEGGPIEMMKGRYSDHIPNVEVYMKGYSGDPLRVDRKSRPPEMVKKPALTLGLTVQPIVIHGLAAQGELRGKGLFARFLYAIPHSRVGYRSNEAPPTPDYLRSAWRNVIKNILNLPDPQKPGDHTLVLAADALVRFQNFRNEVEERLRPGADLRHIKDWGNKLCGAVARLAGVLHLLKHFANPVPWALEIADDTMEGAIQLGRYFEGHAHIAFGMMGADPRVERARGLWANIERLELETFTQRDLHQRVRKLSADDLHGTLNVLADMGYVRPLPPAKAGGAGRPASTAYEVNPLARPQDAKGSTPDLNFVDSEDIVYASEGSDFISEDLNQGTSQSSHPPNLTHNPQNTQNSSFQLEEDVGEV